MSELESKQKRILDTRYVKSSADCRYVLTVSIFPESDTRQKRAQQHNKLVALSDTEAMVGLYRPVCHLHHCNSDSRACLLSWATIAVLLGGSVRTDSPTVGAISKISFFSIHGIQDFLFLHTRKIEGGHEIPYIGYRQRVSR